MAAAWPDLTVEEGSLRFHISRLRRALGDGIGGMRYIKNLPGRGYCFVAPATPIAPLGQLAPGGATLTRPPQGLPYRLNRMVGRDAALEHSWGVRGLRDGRPRGLPPSATRAVRIAATASSRCLRRPPPAHLLLGSDADRLVRDKLAALLTEFGAHRDLALSTDFDQ